MTDLTKNQKCAQEMLEAVDAFMSGAALTEYQNALADAAHIAGLDT